MVIPVDAAAVFNSHCLQVLADAYAPTETLVRCTSAVGALASHPAAAVAAEIEAMGARRSLTRIATLGNTDCE